MEMGRKASLEEGAQTEEANHPGDGSPERLCGPVVQSSHGTDRPHSRKPQARAFPVRSYNSDRHGLSLRANSRRKCVRDLLTVYPQLFCKNGFPVSQPFCLGGSQNRSREPSTGWFTLPVCSPFWGNASRSFPLWGLLARNAGRPLTGAVPLCHFVTFPPHSGGNFPLSLRDISPTLWRNLPAPPQSLRCPLRSAPCLCATGARRPLKRLAKLLCFAHLWLENLQKICCCGKSVVL